MRTDAERPADAGCGPSRRRFFSWRGSRCSHGFEATQGQRASATGMGAPGQPLSPSAPRGCAAPSRRGTPAVGLACGCERIRSGSGPPTRRDRVAHLGASDGADDDVLGAHGHGVARGYGEPREYAPERAVRSPQTRVRTQRRRMRSGTGSGRVPMDRSPPMKYPGPAPPLPMEWGFARLPRLHRGLSRTTGQGRSRAGCRRNRTRRHSRRAGSAGPRRPRRPRRSSP